MSNFEKYSKFVNQKIKYNDKEIKLTNYITSGGNSAVFECEYENNLYVVKFFVGNRSKRYKRFQLEVENIKTINEKLKNYTPNVIDKYFPKFNKNFGALKINDENIGTSPFYIMEKGEKYNYSNLNFQEKLNDIIEICNNLKQLHDIDITHRDIKPDNIVKYNNKLTFIDYGTARISDKTLGFDERMGSRGTIAPEMIDRSKSNLTNEDYKFSDIYSLGKSIWMILNNDIMAEKFTTYSYLNENSKLKIGNVHETIILVLEKLLTAVTQENHLKRMPLNEVIDNLMFIKDDLINNTNLCDSLKFKYLLERYIPDEVDSVCLVDVNKQEKILTNKYNVNIGLSLKENDKSLSTAISINAFSIIPNSNGIYYFMLNDIKFIFEVEKIIINKEEVCIKTKKNNWNNIEEDSVCLNDLEPLEKMAILTKPINEVIKNIYLECDVCIGSIEN